MYLRGGRLALGMLVQSVMRRAVVYADPSDSIARVSEMMKEKHIRSVVVCSPDKAVKGIVTDSDIIFRGLGKVDAHTTPVQEIMTKDPFAINPTADVLEVVSIMRQHSFRRMPVVDGGKLVGIISIGDIAPLVMLHIESLRTGL